jgi:hypothetical protein
MRKKRRVLLGEQRWEGYARCPCRCQCQCHCPWVPHVAPFDPGRTKTWYRNNPTTESGNERVRLVPLPVSRCVHGRTFRDESMNSVPGIWISFNTFQSENIQWVLSFVSNQLTIYDERMPFSVSSPRIQFSRLHYVYFLTGWPVTFILQRVQYCNLRVRVANAKHDNNYSHQNFLLLYFS